MLACLQPHLLGSSNFSELQSAYSKGHSTETALLEILDGAFTAADDKQFTMLIGLDLSATFDSVDLRLLLDRLIMAVHWSSEQPLSDLLRSLSSRSSSNISSPSVFSFSSFLFFKFF